MHLIFKLACDCKTEVYPHRMQGSQNKCGYLNQLFISWPSDKVKKEVWQHKTNAEGLSDIRSYSLHKDFTWKTKKRCMIAPKACSHLIYTWTLTGVCQAIFPANFMYLYPREPWRVTYSRTLGPKSLNSFSEEVQRSYRWPQTCCYLIYGFTYLYILLAHDSSWMCNAH